VTRPSKAFVVAAFTAFVAVFAAASASPAAAQESGTLKKIRDNGVIVLGVRDASVPFSYFNADGEAIGYSVDLCRRVVDHIKAAYKLPNLDVRLQTVTSATRIPLIQNGTIDLECGSTVNNVERHQQVDFSYTTFVVNTKFIVKKAAGIQSVTDLKGKTVAVTSGTNTSGKISALSQQQALELNVVNGSDHAQSFLLLTSDRASAFSEDDILLAGLAATSRTPDAFALVAIPGMLGDPYALMLRKDDAPFKSAVNTALRAVFAAPDFRSLYDKWFVKPIPPKNVVLNFPMSEQLRRVIATPTDSPEPTDYK
jgi:glutamate/aspartate transport system substrate-binding protein